MDESEVLKFERLRITTLSQAIREGARLRPQAHTGWMNNGCSCAYGAAAEALGLPYKEDDEFGRIPTFLQTKIPNLHALSLAYTNRYGVHIFEDNGIHKLTREAIADKLEAIGY